MIFFAQKTIKKLDNGLTKHPFLYHEQYLTLGQIF